MRRNYARPSGLYSPLLECKKIVFSFYTELRLNCWQLEKRFVVIVCYCCYLLLLSVSVCYCCCCLRKFGGFYLEHSSQLVRALAARLATQRAWVRSSSSSKSFTQNRSAPSTDASSLDSTWCLINLVSTMTSAFFFIWCQVFRRAQEPQDKEHYEKSCFNLLIEYDSKAAREELPGTFEYLQVNIWKS